MSNTIPLLDLLTLLIETPASPRHVAPLMIFKLPANVRAGAVAKIVAAWRQARPVPPFNCVPEFPRLGLPRWRVADEIDMRYHVRHITLPAPGTLDQLRELIEVLHTERMDRERPLFQVLVIDGVEGGRFAVYAKMHHAIIDGLSALMRVSASLSEVPGSSLRLPIHALDLGAAGEFTRPVLSDRLAALSRGVVRRANAVTELYGKIVGESVAALKAGRVRHGQLFSAPHVVSNEAFGIGRAIALFSLPLQTMRTVGKAFGGTLNDVVLTVVDAALLRYLAQRGELPATRLVAACPVATREQGDTRAGTDATMIFIPLGAPDAAPHERLEQIIANARSAKNEVRALSKQAAKDYALLALGVSEGIGAVGLRGRVAPLANVAVSNVPGPQVPLYLGRAKLESIFPISMLASGIGLNVTLVSTADEMHFGVVAGASLMPDVRDLERWCREALAALARRSIRRRSKATGLRDPGGAIRAARRR
jgi:WS/DGAT/MGAT family acyltransferase